MCLHRLIYSSGGRHFQHIYLLKANHRSMRTSKTSDQLLDLHFDTEGQTLLLATTSKLNCESKRPPAPSFPHWQYIFDESSNDFLDMARL